VGEPCPECGYPVLFEKSTKRDGTFIACTEEGCGYRRSPEAEPVAAQA
jgi:DNA topoisomerase-1